MEMYFLYVVGAAILCFLMTWGVGANDLANVMSTTMGSKAISVRKAIIIAVIFEFLGAFFGGSDVTETMRDGIINTSELADQPHIMIEGMLSVLLACTVWMNLASFFGLPVSITNALVGSMVGFGAIVLGGGSIHWDQVGHIAIGWVTSPMISGVVGYLLFITIQQAIFVRSDPLTRAKKYIPYYLLLVGIVLSYITVFKGLDHFGIHLTTRQDIAITFLSSITLTWIGTMIIRRLSEPEQLNRRNRFEQVEKYFAVLMGLTACAMVFAHGANDVSLAIGPLSIVYSLAVTSGSFTAESYPSWITLIGCIGVISGFLMYGRKVIETVGSSITALTPSRAFAATLAAATTVVVATSTGIPVSATQTLVGAVLGVGLARGIGALNLIVIRNIFTSWVLTLPAASVLSIIAFKLLHYLLNNL